ncbi:MAG: dTDP-4-dehydrorhamnose 3,5-epimerase [Rhizobiales bacterium]|nr:dTDP-4-dehydrorhamnose 3,5-epimerase [Hyphomicrobiales bacterium]MBI3674285.1 dTDP-4-dehydrorhamnose 3,5-epimerase [Hyphomicrobiales bacterium]
MDIRPLGLDGVVEIVPKKFGDARGFFSETWSKKSFAAAGLAIDWVQDNLSFSAEAGVLRGLHFQVAPFAQDKLIRVLRGAIFDVAVDLRQASPSYGRWVSCVLTPEAWNGLLIPRGFAHGFLTLQPATEVFYKVSAPYAQQCDRSIRWDDPAIAVDWPVGDRAPILSDKDRVAPLLSEAGDISF